jgi:hypothetical protein
MSEAWQEEREVLGSREASHTGDWQGSDSSTKYVCPFFSSPILGCLVEGAGLTARSCAHTKRGEQPQATERSPVRQLVVGLLVIAGTRTTLFVSLEWCWRHQPARPGSAVAHTRSRASAH